MKYSLHFVMLLLLGFFNLKLIAQQNNAPDHLSCFPKPLHYANDMENIYSFSELQSLDSLLKHFDRKTGVEIKLVTVDSIFASRYKFDEIINKIGQWNIGKNVFVDSSISYNCIFVLLSKWQGRVKVFSESSFYRIGELLDNTESNTIVHEAMIPLWSKAQYYDAALIGLHSLVKRIEEVLKEQEEQNLQQ